MNPGQRLFIIGTYYNRRDADWYDFTNGREYERKGHYHARIMEKCTNIQHEVFHLRELIVSKNVKLSLLITSINQVVKITPIDLRNGKYFCSVTGKTVDTLIGEFKIK